MPKRVDHDERRRSLAAALVRHARRNGLHATGFREVAAEAGVSVNLVQYYFPTKADLLVGGLGHVRQLITERLADLPSEPDARVRAILHELLPADEAATDLYRIHAAYAALAFTDDTLADQPHAAGPDQLHPELTRLLAGRSAEPSRVAISLLALGTGLSAYVTSGYVALADARRALDDALDAALSPGSG
jgi:AcrR family transcriptional regulator